MLYSREGVTQGDPLSMLIYGLTLVPLAKRLRDEVPNTNQPWYADDCAMSGTSTSIAKAMVLLLKLGPQRGYFPEPSKSIIVCRADCQEQVAKNLARFQFQYTDGHRYLGTFLGSPEARQRWLQPQIDQWVGRVRKLSRIAKKYPQSAYAGMTKSLQAEWQYLQRVNHSVADDFAPLDDAIAQDFVPALFGDDDPLHPNHQDCIALPVRHSGLGLPPPTTTANEQLRVSRLCSEPLFVSLRANEELSVNAYNKHVNMHRRDTKTARDATYSQRYDNLMADQPSAIKRIQD